MNVKTLISDMYEIVDPKSRISSPMCGVIIMEIKLKAENRIKDCDRLIPIFKQFSDAKWQMIMTILEDDNNVLGEYILRKVEGNTVEI